MPAHPMDCVCEACMTEAFGLLDDAPPDLEEVVEARYQDVGLEKEDK
jgi:hypothetical protein